MLENKDLVYFNKAAPLTIIGGVPESGSTLLCSILQQHSSMHCTNDTYATVKLLEMTDHSLESPIEKMRLHEAGIERDLLDEAFGAFFMNYITQKVEPDHHVYSQYTSEQHLCINDPMLLGHINALSRILTHSKFILMIRDGRAAAYAMKSKHIHLLKASDNYKSILESWNTLISNMYRQCNSHSNCLSIYYELLLLKPQRELKRILEFMGVQWKDDDLAELM